MTVSSEAQALSSGKTAGLVTGDLLMFVLFAAVGRSAHTESTDFGELARIAAPLAIGWVAVAPWMHIYRAGIADRLRPALLRTTLTWALAGPLGLLIRRWVFKDSTPVPFIITTLLFNLILLLVWRAVAVRRLRRQSQGWR